MTSKTATFFKKNMLPCLPYAPVFWFADKLGMAYRMASGDNFLKRLARSMATLGTAMDSPLPSFQTFDMAVGLAAAAAVYAIVRYKKKNAKKWRKGVEYGSACWGTAEDIKPFIDPNPENNIILTQTEGLTMNPRPSSPQYARNKNVLVIGGSGSGKTRFFIKPNLMQCRSKDFPVSFVVTDPNGKLY
jgi:type IV secretion system protein VirD4